MNATAPNLPALIGCLCCADSNPCYDLRHPYPFPSVARRPPFKAESAIFSDSATPLCAALFCLAKGKSTEASPYLGGYHQGAFTIHVGGQSGSTSRHSSVSACDKSSFGMCARLLRSNSWLRQCPQAFRRARPGADIGIPCRQAQIAAPCAMAIPDARVAPRRG